MARKTSFKLSNKWMVFVIGILIGSIPFLFLGIATTSPYNAYSLAGYNKADCPPKAADGKGAMALRRTANEFNDDPKVVHPSWCHRANCTNTDLCRPCQRRFLIVIATGRSASTTLTWMLNELPGIRMSGENNNQLNAILEMKTNIWNHSSFHHGSERKNAWGHNFIPQQTFACAAQAMIQTINPPKLVDQQFIDGKETERRDIVGFKTIRFERGGPERYIEMVDFVKENYPCHRVIININSDVKRQAKSFKAAKFTHVSERSLIRRNEKLKRVNGMFGEQAFFLDSANWTKDVELLNEAVDWLGFHKACRFNDLLKFNTAGAEGFQNEKTELSNQDPKCVRI